MNGENEMNGEVVKITKVTAEEAQAFRDRVKKQHEELSTWIIIPIDEFIKHYDDCGTPQE